MLAAQFLLSWLTLHAAAKEATSEKGETLK